MTTDEAFAKIVETLTKDSNLYAGESRLKINAIFERAQTAENATGNRTLVLDPTKLHGIALEDLSSTAYDYLVYVILSKDPRKFYERLERLYEENKITGLTRVKLHNTRGVAIVYLHVHIGHLFPLLNDSIDANALSISCKYFLPSIYRLLEEAESPPPFIYEAEKQWIKLVDGNIPIDRFRFNEPSEKTRALHRMIMDHSGTHKTGVTAALISLGVSRDVIPFPIELTAENLEQATSALKSQLTKFTSGVEVHQNGVNYPSGNWYLTDVQFIVDGRLVLILHDTIKYVVYGLAKDELSPFIIMAQLCYSAWTLERRSIDRAKWVYSILLRYREKYCSANTIEKEILGASPGGAKDKKYELRGDIVEWPVNYLHRSKQL